MDLNKFGINPEKFKVTENELLETYAQKEQKGLGEVFATIAHKDRKVENINKSVWCPYKSQPRWVSWAVCEWHREKNDPECQGCTEKDIS